MSIILFTSLSGSPGVTTSAVAATVNWHRPAMLIEADTSKTSSIHPGYLRGEIDHSRGLSPYTCALCDRVRTSSITTGIPLMHIWPTSDPSVTRNPAGTG